MGMQARFVIGGFGAAGASCALALHKGGIPASDILIFDRDINLERPPGQDARILALNAGSRHFLEALGVWDALAPEAWPMHAMALSDTALEEAIRPAILGMTESDEAQPLSHLVALPALQSALRQACSAAGITVRKGEFRTFSCEAGHILVDVSGEIIKAELLIAADGGASPIRLKAGIATHGWAYGQTAIVATIRHSGRHAGEAIQHFLPSGPFALLPLDEGRSSIVWSEKADIAKDVLAMSAPDRLREIAKRAAGVRGEIEAVEVISAHPLQLKLSRRFYGERVALVADAAHVVHPLAGQGLNLGFEDAAMLAELIVERARLGMDCGMPDLLEEYQQRRRPAAVAMAYATEAINRLFSNDFGPLRVLRDVGLGLVERFPRLKSGIVRAAAGQISLSPKLFRGERV